ncbi:Uncharacterised protein at_DN1307 [Pycnogonum litorale]
MISNGSKYFSCCCWLFRRCFSCCRQQNSNKNEDDYLKVNGEGSGIELATVLVKDKQLQTVVGSTDDLKCATDIVQEASGTLDSTPLQQSSVTRPSTSDKATETAAEPRRRSSGGLQRQTGICIPDSDEFLDLIGQELEMSAVASAQLTAHRDSTTNGESSCISQSPSPDLKQETRQVLVEIHRGWESDLLDTLTKTKQQTNTSTSESLDSPSSQQKLFSTDDKDSSKSRRTMDLEDFHYTQSHGASNVANWILGDCKRSCSAYDVVRPETAAKWRDNPQRTASVESSDLEEVMEKSRRRTSDGSKPKQTSYCGALTFWSDEDDEPKSKVRYNDTGSKEEVNEEVLDLYVEDIDLIEMDEEAPMSVPDYLYKNAGESSSIRHVLLSPESICAQYRELWQLRATLEDEDLSDIACFDDDSAVRATNKKTISDVPMDVNDDTNGEAIDVRVRQDQECDISRTGKIQDVETLDDQREINVSDLSPTLTDIHTCQSRRQSYKSVLTRRLHRTDSSGGQTSVDSLCPPSTDNSFDSYGTVDTEEGFTTDASRPEGISTSFESTADYADITGGDGQNNSRLQQMKADSGYKSIENQNCAKKAPRLGRKKLSFALDDVSVENVPPQRTDIASVDEGVEISDLKDTDQQNNEKVDMKTSTTSLTSVTESKILESNSKKERARKGCHLSGSFYEKKSASKKRREYMKERQPSSASLPLRGDYSSVDRIEPDYRSDQYSDTSEGTKFSSNSKSSLFFRFFRSSHRSNRSRIHFRDYSIDEKSDSLFREFSRQDPLFESTSVDCLMRSRSPRLHPRQSNRQRFHHHSRQIKLETSGSPRTCRRKLSPQDSIEEETCHPESDLESRDGSDVMGGKLSAIPLKSSDESLIRSVNNSSNNSIMKLVREEVAK